jgi:GDPmannose 4,6-dehydratase
MMLQQDQPEDFVIATGKQYSVRDFVIWSAQELGLDIEFTGSGLEEVGTVKNIFGTKAPSVNVGDIILRVDDRYYRPTETDSLLGDPSKAREKLGWVPSTTAQQMCSEMIESDLKLAHEKLKILNI